MKSNHDYYQLEELIAIRLLAYKKCISLKLPEKFIYPTREEALEEYRNDPFFHRTVESLADNIRKFIEEKRL